MDMPIVAGMDVERETAHPPAMVGVVAGVIISVMLWAVIGLVIYLVVRR
jgi:predicted cobalt transporter CbtA